MTKTSVKIIFPLLALALFLPFSAKAFAVKTGNAINISKSEIIDGNLYAAGSTLVIEGQVKGDVICAGQAVNISGKVDGDVICAGQSVEVTGEVGGSVRVAGTNININNKVGRNVMAFGTSVILGSKAQVAMDMLVGAAYASLNGQINGNLHGGGAMFTLNGAVGKDVALTMDAKQQTPALVLTNNATIGGNLSYTSPTMATIAKKDNIAGKTNRTLPQVKERYLANSMMAGLATMWLWCKIISLFGALLIGLFLVLMFKDKILVLADDMVARPGTAIGHGALLLFVAPVILFFLALTIIGIPLAFILGLSWLLLMMLGKILVAIFAGLILMGRYRHKKAKNEFKTETKGNMLLSMIVGVTVTFALFIIPVFGWVLAIIGKMWGMGILWLAMKKNCCTK
jgi:cytoskeletal protein CcmA (bactofilin family)